ncbi:polysaccharide lyase beta-sandwich domain-containing protein [Streptomyces vastus]|uniref:polysaccharide lyase beta-sandwich domain-containing protein n=1 Tax=Streptomyces vastus TaxID=285451 RepID=UPI0031CEC363
MGGRELGAVRRHVERARLHARELKGSLRRPRARWAGLGIDGPASVIVRRERRGPTTVAVSDPTMHRDTVTVLLCGRPQREVTSGDGVRVRAVHGGTRLDFDTRHAHGRSFLATLRSSA